MIYVLGSNGFLAKKISKFLKSKNIIFRTYSSRSRSNNFDLLKFEHSSLIKKIKENDIIIFPNTISSPDLFNNNKNYDFYFRKSKDFIKLLLKRNIKIIFFSTDAVYNENSASDENSDIKISNLYPYEKFKYKLEKFFLSNKNFKSIRLSYVVATDDSFSKYLKTNKKNSFIRVFHEYKRSYVHIEQVVNGIYAMVLHWNFISPNVINFCGTKCISKKSLTSLLLKKHHFEKKYKILNESQEDQKNFFKNRKRVIDMKSLYFKQLLSLVGHKFKNINEYL